MWWTFEGRLLRDRLTKQQQQQQQVDSGVWLRFKSEDMFLQSTGHMTKSFWCHSCFPLIDVLRFQWTIAKFSVPVWFLMGSPGFSGVLAFLILSPSILFWSPNCSCSSCFTCGPTSDSLLALWPRDMKENTWENGWFTHHLCSWSLKYFSFFPLCIQMKKNECAENGREEKRTEETR